MHFSQNHIFPNGSHNIFKINKISDLFGKHLQYTFYFRLTKTKSIYSKFENSKILLLKHKALLQQKLKTFRRYFLFLLVQTITTLVQIKNLFSFFFVLDNFDG